MTNKTTSTSSISSPSRHPHPHPNDFGSDLWVRNNCSTRPAPIHGRGMFAGLQDVKHYRVDHGWAKRSESAQSGGLFSFLWNRIFGGAYRPPPPSASSS